MFCKSLLRNLLFVYCDFLSTYLKCQTYLVEGDTLGKSLHFPIVYCWRTAVANYLTASIGPPRLNWRWLEIYEWYFSLLRRCKNSHNLERISQYQNNELWLWIFLGHQLLQKYLNSGKSRHFDTLWWYIITFAWLLIYWLMRE